MHAANLIDISDRLPIKIEFIESREKVDALLGKLEELAGSGADRDAGDDGGQAGATFQAQRAADARASED